MIGKPERDGVPKQTRARTKRTGKPARFRLKPACAAVLLAFAAQSAQANPDPTGALVANGQASFATSGNTLTVTNTPGAIINWPGFSIGAGERVHFDQAVSSSVLNRVAGPKSEIFGALTSPGRVFLINPNGIVFGAGSVVDVAGMVASTLKLSDADFLAGRHRFTTPTGGGAGVSNAGNISARTGGQIYLIAPDVKNTGVIKAPNGEILLAAGRSVELVDTATPNLRVNITAPAGDATNVGTLVAEAGSLGLFGTVVRNSGTVSADSAVREGGRIVFKASQRVEAGGTVSANSTALPSPLTTTPPFQGEGRGGDGVQAEGVGGTIALLGNQVGIMDGAIVTANGIQGGGTIHVGGDYQGKNPDVPNAQVTYVASTATLSADATQNGNGGKVIVWADDTTRAYGTITARGGANGGNGGFIETSGKQYLDVAGIKINTAAPNGTGGTWLLDPYDLNVTTSATNAVLAGGPPYSFTSGSGGSNILNTDIEAQLNGGTSVTLQTSGTAGDGFGNGGITVSANIAKTAGGAATLLFKAHNDIVVGAGVGISSTAGSLNVVLNSDSDGIGGGAIVMNTGSSIASNGGNITLGGGAAGNGTGNAVGNATYVNGITLDGASINAGGGNTSLRGTGVAGTGSWRYGVFLQNGATVTSTGTGAITLDGTGGAAINGNYGVMLETNSQVSTVNGAISITGHGGAGTTSENVGVGVQQSAKVTSTGAGTITLNGTGGAGTNTNRGVYIDGAGTLITSVNGDISITGQGAGSTFDNRGIYISGGAKVKATGAASVTLDGTGSAAGTNFNYGVYLKNLGTEVSASSGAVSITGHGAGSGTDNYGVWVTDYAKVASAGAGTITLDGFGSAASTGSYNTGAYISSNATISATGTGGIVVNGSGGSTGTAGFSNRGVRVSSAASISTNSGAIGITGTGGYGGDGVQVVGGTHVQSGTGAITLDGTAVDSSSSDAVYVSDTGTLVTSGGNIGITGHNFSTIGGGNRGVAITSSAQVVTTGAGAITMTGQGGHDGDGLDVHGGALVQSGTGLITLNGTSGNGTGSNWDWGVVLYGAGTLVTSGGGMTITGVSTSTNSADSNHGIIANQGVTLTTTAGLMTLTGTKGAGATSDAVLLSGTDVVNAAAGLTVTGTGDVVVDTGSVVNAGGNATFSATNNILFSANSSLAPSAGALNIGLYSDSNGAGGGGIYLDTGSSLSSNGGNITMGGGTPSSNGYAIGNGTVTGGIAFYNGIRVRGSITAGAGNVTMRGQGATGWAALDIDPVLSAGTISLSSSGGDILLNDLNATATGLTASQNAISIQSAGWVKSAAMNAVSGSIQITGDAGVDLDAYDNTPTIRAQAGNVTISSANGDVTAAYFADIIGQNVNINAAGSVSDQDGPNYGTITANALTVTAGAGINLHTAAGNIATTNTGAGGTVISNTGALTVGNMSDAGAITLSGNMALTQATGTAITANTLSVSAGSGINLLTAVSNLTTTNTGAGNTVIANTVIANTGALTVNGMADTSGSITLNNAGNVTVSGGMSANGIALTASGAASDIIIDASVTSGNGMTVNAGHDLLVGQVESNDAYLIATAGTQTITAGRDMTLEMNGGDAQVESHGGLQTITVGRDLLVQVTDNFGGTEAHIEGGAGQIVTVGGNLTLNALDDDQTRINADGGNQTITVGGNMTLNAAQDIAHVRSLAGTQTVTVSGNLTLTGSSAYMTGSLGQTITVGGNLNMIRGDMFSGGSATLQIGNGLTLSNGATVRSNGTLYGSVGGNVTITGGFSGNTGLFGSHDIGSPASPFRVGGTINMDGGEGAPYYGAQIHSDEVASIWIHFPNLTSGGYFVNGTEGAVSSGMSGFYAMGSPAFLGSNLHITYGPPSTNLGFMDNLVNTMLIPGNGAAGASQSTIKKKEPPPVVVVDGKAQPAKDTAPPPLPVCPGGG